ncbi:heme utilization cystosolic carrier protein HutX [Desulfoluna butyratoxydans]|uniref:Haem utilisation chux/hutx n=1 Tax=Desulfoluna butyratoxydans TaxID=231438 RepID=A0A4U8YRZ9_9BACT|nr:heme utilization cystosolic carrier protein HutX [Desulfoluna butyratoxydans]VFQ46109.1 haem utilisation chux/hutx [Desulfoluna butyratoxydans]
MFEDSVTPDIKARIQEMIDENPSTMPGQMAAQLHISEAAVVSALPNPMATFVDAAHFNTVWEAMTGWEKVTFLRQSPTSVIEVKGKLPKGTHGHGYFNLMDRENPLGGHLKVDKLGAICFLEKPFFGLESLSVQFYDTNGDHMFAVYAGREKRTLIPSVKAGFHALRNQLTSKE